MSELPISAAKGGKACQLSVISGQLEIRPVSWVIIKGTLISGQGEISLSVEWVTFISGSGGGAGVWLCDCDGGGLRLERGHRSVVGEVRTGRTWGRSRGGFGGVALVSWGVGGLRYWWLTGLALYLGGTCLNNKITWWICIFAMFLTLVMVPIMSSVI